MKNSRNGFTLVELLAVIVILAIILVIAVPQIMNVIKDTTKASFESSAKMVVAQVENQYTVAQTLSKEFDDTGSCMEDWAGLNDVDYASCTYEIDEDGNAQVTLVGKGKFKDLRICRGTRSSATAIEADKCILVCKENEVVIETANAIKPYVVKDYDSCISYTKEQFTGEDYWGYSDEEHQAFCRGEEVDGYTFEANVQDMLSYAVFTEVELIENKVIKGNITETCVPSNGVSRIEYEYNTSASNNGLIKDDTEDENIRYAGSNDDVKNYVEFGNNGELWRIIGVFNMGTSSSNNERLLKIIRDEPFIDGEENPIEMSWDSSASTINSGDGVNEWSQSDLKTMLNTYYLGTTTTCTYCNDYNQATCENSCNDNIVPINTAYRSMIEEVKWPTGTVNYQEFPKLVDVYNFERGNEVKKGNTGSYCNDNVERQPSWLGKVGLAYLSDYAYASNSEVCTNSSLPFNSNCDSNNWLGEDYRVGHSMTSYYAVLSAFGNGPHCGLIASGGSGLFITSKSLDIVRPSLYLKSSVKIIKGDGSYNNPYKLSL